MMLEKVNRCWSSKKFSILRSALIVIIPWCLTDDASAWELAKLFSPLFPSTEHHERYYLYLIISVTIGVLLCLIIITGRIIIQKQHDDAEDSSKDEPKFHKSNTGETTITKGFSGDNICDMEGGDIDLTTPMGMSSLPLKNEVMTMLMNLHARPSSRLKDDEPTPRSRQAEAGKCDFE
jgi:hypothetical protein